MTAYALRTSSGRLLAVRPRRRQVYEQRTALLAGTGLTWRKLRRSRGWRIVRVEVRS